jgi:hypothetical protein
MGIIYFWGSWTQGEKILMSTDLQGMDISNKKWKMQKRENVTCTDRTRALPLRTHAIDHWAIYSWNNQRNKAISYVRTCRMGETWVSWLDDIAWGHYIYIWHYPEMWYKKAAEFFKILPCAGVPIHCPYASLLFNILYLIISGHASGSLSINFRAATGSIFHH